MKQTHGREITKPVGDYCNGDKVRATYFRAGFFFLIKSKACLEAAATFSACSGSKRRSTDVDEEVVAEALAVGNTDTLDVSLDVMIPAAVALVVVPVVMPGLIPLDRPSSSLITVEEWKEGIMISDWGGSFRVLGDLPTIGTMS